MAYPSTYTSFNRPTSTDRLNSPSHSALHNTVSSAVGQIEQTIGLSTSSLVGTLYYDIRSPDSNGGGHVQTANKGGTGQTAYTKGDVLVASSSSVLTKLSVGATDGLALVVDSSQATGVKWGNPGLNVQSFLSTGTWVRPSTASRIFVELWGGGGSGAAATTDNEASGGGGGAYVSGWMEASTLTASQIVIIGAGGASVTGNTAGNAGGVTVFGVTSLFSAFGGGAGKNAITNSTGGGGGGFFAVGQNGVDGGAAGSPGFPFSGTGGVGNTGSVGAISGGGGGANGTTAGNGGNTVWGGGGGGAGTSSSFGTGGVSQFGGNGGRGAASVVAFAGSVPGGGGGGCYLGISGEGGNGKAIITTYLG